jgi:N-acetylmuramoyl-L-alanine amidase
MKKIKAFIDQGHGGKDPGATHTDEETEQFFGEGKINFVVAAEAAKGLLATGRYEVMLSRDSDDTYLSLSDRAKMANDWGADIFVSIHHNAAGGDGYEVIHSIYGGKGELLAHAIAAEFEKAGQNPHGSRGVYSRESDRHPGKDWYGVVRSTFMPAVITEFAYVDNDTDNDIIDTDAELVAEGRAIAKGIMAVTA